MRSHQPVAADESIQGRATQPQLLGGALDVPVTDRQLGVKPRAVVEPKGALGQFGQQMFRQQDRSVHQRVEAFHQRLEFPHVPTPGLTLEDRGGVRAEPFGDRTRAIRRREEMPREERPQVVIELAPGPAVARRCGRCGAATVEVHDTTVRRIRERAFP